MVQRWEEEVVIQENLSSLDALSPQSQSAEFNAQLILVRTALPDLQVTIEDMIATNNEVALRSTLRGTH